MLWIYFTTFYIVKDNYFYVYKILIILLILKTNLLTDYFSKWWLISSVYVFYSNMIKIKSPLIIKILKDFCFQNGGVEGIWTLAPVSRSIPLAGAPLQPLEYYSEIAI